MRKDLGKKMAFMPLPVLIIGTYDENGQANAMNAAWGVQCDMNQIMIALSDHKTTDNLQKTNAFTVAFATKDTEVISDYYGVVSGRNEDKIDKSGVHVRKSNFVNAPIIEEYPVTLECTVDSFEDELLFGTVVNVSVDEAYLTDQGRIDVDKVQPITFDPVTNSYRVIGEVIGHAFRDGLKLNRTIVKVK